MLPTRIHSDTQARRPESRKRRASIRGFRRAPSRFELRICALAVVTVVGFNDGSTAHADAWTAEEVSVARHCVSERSFADSDDCRVIAWIDSATPSGAA